MTYQPPTLSVCATLRDVSRIARAASYGVTANAARIERAEVAAAALTEAIADIRQARAALSQNATFPGDVALARRALAHALEMLGEPTNG